MSIYFIGEKQTLQNILTSREERVEYQKYLLNRFGYTVVSYKLNIPGPIKYSWLIKQIFDEGLGVFKLKLEKGSIKIQNDHVIYRNSGPEYFAAINRSPYIIKEITTKIEENHPLGRIYDFDVLSFKGTHIERQELGIKPRKCLICDGNAFECGRSRTHEVSELIDKIESMALNYFKKI